jgi:hypothetical protein
MIATIRRGAVIVILALSAACEGSLPTAPTGTSPSPSETPLPGLTAVPKVRSLPSVTPPISFPPLSGPAHTFIFEHAGYRVAAYTQTSRFVLYDNGAFVLQYTNPGGQYRGSYTEENGVIDFTWEDSSNAYFPWDATGTLEGDSLNVQYNLNMQLSDFEDAVYTRTP